MDCSTEECDVLLCPCTGCNVDRSAEECDALMCLGAGCSVDCSAEECGDMVVAKLAFWNVFLDNKFVLRCGICFYLFFMLKDFHSKDDGNCPHSSLIRMNNQKSAAIYMHPYICHPLRTPRHSASQLS